MSNSFGKGSVPGKVPVVVPHGHKFLLWCWCGQWWEYKTEILHEVLNSPPPDKTFLLKIALGGWLKNLNLIPSGLLILSCRHITPLASTSFSTIKFSLTSSKRRLRHYRYSLDFDFFIFLLLLSVHKYKPLICFSPFCFCYLPVSSDAFLVLLNVSWEYFPIFHT